MRSQLGGRLAFEKGLIDPQSKHFPFQRERVDIAGVEAVVIRAGD